MATLFDWKAWNVSCQSGPLAIELWSAIIRRAASNFMDSQLWLLEHNLSWIERADVGIQHVAAQLSVAIKPFAGMYTLIHTYRYGRFIFSSFLHNISIRSVYSL